MGKADGAGLGAGPCFSASCLGGSRAESRPIGPGSESTALGGAELGGALLWALDRGGPGKGVV